MQLKSNTRGFTLVELMIAVALLGMALSGAYYLLSFSMKSYQFTEAKFVAEQDARMVIKSMDADIHKARSVIISGINHKAVELSDSGMKATIYTDADGDGAIDTVQYKLENNQLKRGEAILGSTPTKWTIVVDRVYNKIKTPAVSIFTISGKQVKINLMIADEADRLKEEPVSVSTSITVRSKGAME